MIKALSFVYDVIFLPKEALLFRQCRNIWPVFFASIFALSLFFVSSSYSWLLVRFFSFSSLVLLSYFFYVLCLDGIAQAFGAKGQLRYSSPWFLFGFFAFFVVGLVSNLFEISVFFLFKSILLLFSYVYMMCYHIVVVKEFYGFSTFKSIVVLNTAVVVFLLGSLLAWTVFLSVLLPNIFHRSVF